MIIKYTFVHQFHPIEGTFNIRSNTITTKELKLNLTKKYKLNILDYSIFQKKKKLNDEYIFLRFIVIIYKNANSVLMKEEKII